VRFIADINACGIGMYHLQTEVIALDFTHRVPPLLPIHLVPFALHWAAFGFHVGLPTLNSTWLGPVSETYTISPAGSGLYPFQDNAATIVTIANTGATLLYRAQTLQSTCGLSCRDMLCLRF